MSVLFSKIKKLWPYFFYGVASLIFFLFVFFPGSMISDYVIKKFPIVFPGSSLSAEKISIVFPPGLRLMKPVFSIKNHGDLIFDKVTIRPSIMTIAGFSRKAKADAEVFDGYLKADASLGDTRDIDDLQIWLKGLNLSKMPKTFFKGYDVKGILDSEVMLKKNGKDLNGSFKVDVAEGGLTLPFLSGVDFTPSSIKVDGTVKDGTAEIKRGIFTAGAFSGDFSGKITISRILEKSVLNLAVNVTRKEVSSDSAPNMMLDAIFKPGAGKKIQVTGTIDSPKYSFN